MNGVSGDLTRPRLNAEHRKATLKPVQIYLYITYKRSQQTLWTWKHTDIMSRQTAPLVGFKHGFSGVNMEL